MNIRILAASILALAVCAPLAYAAPVHRPATNTSGIDKCAGNLDIGTMECKISPASSGVVMPLALQTSTVEMVRGTGGSNPAWNPATEKSVLVMKANPVLDFSAKGGSN